MADLDRRSLLALAAGTALLPSARVRPRPQDPAPAEPQKKLQQSACRWIYRNIPLDDFCRQCQEIGIVAIDLLTPNEWMVPKKHGLVCSMAYGPSKINRGFNRQEHHDEFVAEAEKVIPRIAEAGIPNMIVFSGNRQGQADDKGVENCIDGLGRIMPLAEKHGVTVCLEYLNSKVDHKDYQFDHMSYGVEICKGVASPRLRILYDIYHAQIMEGDVIRTIRDNIDLIGHFHTGGVPGRNDIDETQELYYPAICRAILATDYDGYVAHEFIPKKDPMATLANAVQRCNVVP